MGPSRPREREETTVAGFLAALVGVLLVVLATLWVAPPPGGVPRDVDRLDLAPPSLHVSLGAWQGTNLTVSARCPNCSSTLAAGSDLTVELAAVPSCDAYGCVASLARVDLAAPFRLVSSAPSLPATLPAAGATVQLVVATPATGGNATLAGSAFGSAPIAPVAILQQAWSLRNATNQSGGFSLGAGFNATYVAPGAVFNDSIVLNNTGPNFEEVYNVTVDAPFALLWAGPGLPFEINSNSSGEVVLELRAPATSGVANLSGVLEVQVLPQIIFSSVNVTFVDNPTPVVLQSSAIPTVNLPGEEFNGSFVLYNPSNTTQRLRLTSVVSGGVVLVNSTPNETFPLNGTSALRIYVTLSGTSPPGTYSLTIVFRVYR